MAKPNQTEQWTKRWHDILDRELGPDPTGRGDGGDQDFRLHFATWRLEYPALSSDASQLAIDLGCDRVALPPPGAAIEAVIGGASQSETLESGPAIDPSF